MAKEDALSAHSSAVVTADGLLYDAGFADGVASVPASTPGTFVQADIDAAVAAKGVADQAALDDMKAQLDASVAKDAADMALIDKIKALLS